MLKEDYESDLIFNLEALKDQPDPIMLGERVLADVCLYDGFKEKPKILQWLSENRLQDFLIPGHPSCIQAELR